MFWNKYPYTDFHELNQDWILEEVKKLGAEMKDFEAINKITFSGAWDITDQYPAWTIVSDNNIGYISIRPVPAGVQLTNNDYWRAVIDYTTQIADLQNRVINLENDVEAIDETLSLTTHHRYVIVTDSYGNVSNSWVGRFKTMVGADDADFFATIQPGAGFKPSYNSYFINYLSALSVTDPDTITDIIVVGGFNDRSTTLSDLDTAVAAFCSYCKTNFKNAKVWIGAFGWSFNTEFLGDLENGKYIHSYKKCTDYGAYYLTGSDQIMRGKDCFLEEDPGQYTLFLNHMYVHPSDKASQMIAGCVSANIFGSGYTRSEQSTVTVNLNTGVSIAPGGAANFTLYQFLNGDKISVYTPQVNLAFSPAIVANMGTDWTLLGTVDGGFIAGNSGATTRGALFSIQAFITGGSPAVSKFLPVSMMIANNRIYAKFATQLDSTAYSDCTNLFILDAFGIIDNIFA